MCTVLVVHYAHNSYIPINSKICTVFIMHTKCDVHSRTRINLVLRLERHLKHYYYMIQVLAMLLQANCWALARLGETLTPAMCYAILKTMVG